MRGWVNIMVRVLAVCLLLIAGVQAGAACAAPNPAPGHSMSHAPTAHSQNIHMGGHRPVAGHPAGSMLCMQGCLSWIDEPIVAEKNISFSKIAVLRPEDKTQPGSLQPDMAERPPKPLV